MWSYQYGYSRSAEARELGDTGQDYVTFIEGEDSIVFALCDGISMSYYGDFAASFLGESLRDWLTTLDPASNETTELSHQLYELLKVKAEEARKQLIDHHIPSYINGMLREVLLAKKKLGSGAIYACGRIDMPSEDIPQGRIVLIWQGDIRIRMWAGAQEKKGYLGDRFHTREQWNSTAGAVGGIPHVYMDHLMNWGNQGKLLLYSDGLQAMDHIDDTSQEGMSRIMKKEADNPSSDDMSIFQIRWHFT